MSSDAMKTVRQLIKEQRYDEARAILRALEHPLAPSWLESLDGLGAGKNEKPGRRWRRTGLIVLVLLLAAVGGAIYLSNNYQQQVLAEESRNLLGLPSQRTALDEYCKEHGLTEEECMEWMLSQTINAEQTPAAPLPGAGLPSLPTPPS